MLAVFLINLDRSPDRLAFMAAQADRIGLQFERISAVDGVAAVPDDLRPQFRGSQLSSGDIGCYASHLTVHQRIVRDGLPYALVIEDDVSLEPDLPTAARAAIEVAPTGWDYIHLSGIIKNPVLSVAILPNGRHLVRHLRVPLNTGGYIISQSGASKILAPAPRFRMIDGEVHCPWVRRLDVLGVYPSPVIHNVLMSTTITDRPKAKYKSGLSLLSRLRGTAYNARKLGLKGYMGCCWAAARFAIARRMDKSRRTTVPVVI